MTNKIKNFCRQVAENYKNGFAYVSDRPGSESNGSLQDKLDKMAEASFENTLRTGGLNEDTIKNIEQKIISVETNIYDFFDKGFKKLDKLADKWNDYIENTDNKKKGVEDGQDERYS